MKKLLLPPMIFATLAVVACSGAPSSITSAGQSSSNAQGQDYRISVDGCVKASGSMNIKHGDIIALLSTDGVAKDITVTGQVTGGRIQGAQMLLSHGGKSGTRIGSARLDGRISSRSGSGHWVLNGSSFCKGTWSATRS